MHAGREFMERFWYHVKNLVNAHTGNKENPHGVTKEQIGLGNVENKSSEMIRAEMTSGDVTDALGYTPSNVSHTHPVSQVTGLTGSRALVSDSSGHPAVSGVTATELGYLDGATSNIQNQINSLNSNLTNVEESVDGLNGNIKFHTKYLQYDNSITPETIIKNTVYELPTEKGRIQTFYIVLLNYGASYVLLAQKLQEGTYASVLAFSYNRENIMFFREFSDGWVN